MPPLPLVASLTLTNDRSRPAWKSPLVHQAAALSLAWWMAGSVLLAADAADNDDDPSLPAQNSDAAPGWPRRFTLDGRTVTIYQPQPEKLDGNVLTARAAVSVAEAGGEPVFGAEWMTAHIDIDRDSRVADVTALSIDRFNFPDGEAGDQATAVLEANLRRTLTADNMSFDLDQLTATLEQEPVDGATYNLAPPHILVRTTPSELVVLDGEPQFAEGDTLRRVVNTPAALWLDAAGAWWLRLDNGWLTAPDRTGPWLWGTPPAALTAAAEAAGLTAPLERAADPADQTAAPTVIVATEPTALVVFGGEPQWTPIGSSGLLAAENSDTDAFIDTATRRSWLLVNGRWFNAERFADDAGWQAVAPNALPASFAAIPADSRWARIRAHISGTPEAHDAASDAQVPQTARIPRDATIAVTYDGAPRFSAIKSSEKASEVEWAENSSVPVFRTAGAKFWSCDQGVWYEAPDAAGPWTVATSIPDALHRIPADNPYHNVSYVYVYDSTPTYVWSGYTAGYTGLYLYDGCPIYGSGWWWHGHYGRGFYHARPLTWGFQVVYNPWTGMWGERPYYHHYRPQYGLAYPHEGIHGGWWGPVGHAPPPMHRPVTGRPGMGVASGGTSGGSRPAGVAGAPPGAVTPGPQPASSSLYHRVPGAVLPTRTQQPGNRANLVPEHADQVFVDRNGTVVRRNEAGAWEERHGRAWNAIPWGQHPAQTSPPATGVAAGGDKPAEKPNAGDKPGMVTKPVTAPAAADRPTTGEARPERPEPRPAPVRPAPSEQSSAVRPAEQHETRPQAVQQVPVQRPPEQHEQRPQVAPQAPVQVQPQPVQRQPEPASSDQRQQQLEHAYQQRQRSMQRAPQPSRRAPSSANDDKNPGR